MSNNKIILSGCIDQYKTQNELTTTDSETFELFALTQITKSNDLAFEDIQNSIVDGSNDGGIDSILVIIDDFVPESIEDIEEIKFSRKTNVEILISQCKRENSFKELAIDRLITTLPELFNLSRSEDALLIRFNPDVVEKGLIARETWKKCSIAGGILKVKFNYCTYSETVTVNDTFIDKVRQLKGIAQSHFVGAKIEYTNYSSEELLKLYQTRKKERLQLKYKETPLSTSYDTFGIGYVGTVKLADYKAFLTDDDLSIREDLFESNIRHFQGLVDVNKKIKDSIENPVNEDFWWLNNGITIIATNPSLVGTTLLMDNVQIVNGLQTSYSIFLNHNGSDVDIRSVLVKVIINEDKKTIDHIIASTNSQNPVSPSLLRATDDVQREIELFFLNSGYFYDRRKNYYKNQGKPAGRIFSIQTAAQAIESIIFNNPNSARSKPTSLIKEDLTYNRIFNPTHNYKAYLVCCLLNKKIVELWGNIEDREIKNKLANFKLHLTRIAASFLTNKRTLGIEDLVNIDIELLDDIIFNKSTVFLTESLDMYQQENEDTNLINMAKTKGFTDALIVRLNERF
ncbi:AIPR family protein [Runella zeae]|uniref:AIPR family protein n=1 Tax=Runella zeae TaxID=94255 RepID=UPI0004198D33|nr:AIPR family protein [Runella zeae]